MQLKCILNRYAALIAIAASFPAFASDGIEPLSKGQTVYVPVYSHIWHGDIGQSGKASSELVSVLISVRNTDPKNSIRVISAPYFSTAGTLIADYLPISRIVGPFATLELFVERRESDGGSGANFAIRWDASTPVPPPIIEALHTTVYPGRTLSFISRGKPISSP